MPVYLSAVSAAIRRTRKSSLHWGLADWDGRWDRSEDVIFSTKFILTIDSLEEYFTKEDLQFFEDQYNGQIINDWNIKSRNSRFKESFKIDYYEYSIPLFSKDFKSAIFYRYYVCGSLCGYSALWIYQWDGEKWVRTKRIKGWMS